MTTGIVLFAHGARDPEWARPLHRLKRMLQDRMPEADIEPAFLEHMAPTLEAAAGGLIARGATEVSIVPVFIANGGHLREDLPRRVEALKALHPGVPVRIAPPIGEVDTILSAITGWIEGMHRPD
jgi:sirohydrochlorin cobaltochelatase